MVTDLNNINMAVPSYKPPTGCSSTRSRPSSSIGGKNTDAYTSRSDSYCKLDDDSSKTYLIPLDSHQLCDVVYEEWLGKKEIEKTLSKKFIREKRKKEQEMILEKQLAKEEKCKKRVELWTIEKDSHLKEKQSKRQKEIEERKHKENEEHKYKRDESDKVYKAWLEKKKHTLKKTNEEKIIHEKKNNEQRKEDVITRMESAQKTFEAWVAQKTIKNHEQTRKDKEKTIQAMTERTSEQKKRNDEAAGAFESWKKKKDVHINNVGKLYTYHPNPREPPKSNKWCPARCMKYDYPSESSAAEKQTNLKSLNNSKTLPKRFAAETKSRISLNETYSLESFDSDKESIVVEDYDESVSDTLSDN